MRTQGKEASGEFSGKLETWNIKHSARRRFIVPEERMIFDLQIWSRVGVIIRGEQIDNNLNLFFFNFNIHRARVLLLLLDDFNEITIVTCSLNHRIAD